MLILLFLISTIILSAIVLSIQPSCSFAYSFLLFAIIINVSSEDDDALEEEDENEDADDGHHQ